MFWLGKEGVTLLVCTVEVLSLWNSVCYTRPHVAYKKQNPLSWEGSCLGLHTNSCRFCYSVYMILSWFHYKCTNYTLECLSLFASSKLLWVLQCFSISVNRFDISVGIIKGLINVPWIIHLLAFGLFLNQIRIRCNVTFLFSGLSSLVNQIICSFLISDQDQ